MRRRDNRFGFGRALDCGPGRVPGRALGGALGAVLALLVASAGARPGLAQEIAGRPQVIDAGTLDFSGRRVRLHGIDAPDMTQTCRLTEQTAARAAGRGLWRGYFVAPGAWRRGQRLP